jgi:hypothetical protein
MEGLELHHIIFRSKAPYMANIPINFIFLTPEEHRGKSGPHHNRKKDLELKKELQAKLKIMFSNKYYTLEQIKEILGVSNKVVERLVKVLQLTKSGYEGDKLVFHMLGDRFYE